MGKNLTLIDFIIECCKGSPNFDFHEVKIGTQIQRLHESINNYSTGNENQSIDIIPQNFQLTGKGRKLGIQCEIPKNNINEFNSFKKELENNNFIINKQKNNLQIRSKI